MNSPSLELEKKSRHDVRDQAARRAIETLPDNKGGSLVLVDTFENRKGIARRLRMLGYQIGDAGPEGNGVEAATRPPAGSTAEAPPITRELDRAILDFEADESLDWNGDESDLRFLSRLDQRVRELHSG